MTYTMLIYPVEIDVTELAFILSEYQDFVWLDSADQIGFSVLAFGSSDVKKFERDTNPNEFFEFLNKKNSKSKTIRLSDYLTVRKNKATESPQVSKSESHQYDLQFEGGWIGYVSYEAYKFNDLIPFNSSHYKDYPLAVFRYYDTFIYIDHTQNKKYFVSLSKDGEHKWHLLNERIKYRKNLSKTTTDFITKDLKVSVTKDKYAACLSEIKESLLKGDYFELNYTMEYNGPFSGSTIALYERLREITQAPMMSYIDFPEVKILSASPERYFKIADNNIYTYPIKGTIKRGGTKKQDALNKDKLLNSSKDKAELLMVTDMLRNDLGRVCETGSIKVNTLVHVVTFSHYHHLISEIAGNLKENYKLSDVFRALFPGGSITGAPKIKVMEHIDGLEGRARGVYTGAIGYISNNGTVDFNIPIRTMTIHDDNLSFAVGGGIVADSDCDAEYEECQVKASGIVEALNLKWKRENDKHV